MQLLNKGNVRKSPLTIEKLYDILHNTLISHKMPFYGFVHLNLLNEKQINGLKLGHIALNHGMFAEFITS